MISGKYLFDEGDVLYSKIRPYLRKAVVAPFRGLCSADMYPLSVRADVVDNHFLSWLLVSDQFTEFANRESGRARMPKLNRQQLLSWVAPLPPLREQQRIVHAMSHGMTAVERARAAAEARREAARGLLAAQLRAVFRGPQALTWSTTSVGAVCDQIDYGYTASAVASLPSPKLLRITDIQDGRVNWEAVPGCVISASDENTKRLADGDIVFARTGATTGKSLLLKEPPRAVFASYLIRLRPKPGVVPAYLYGFFQSDEYWQQIRRSARGGAQANVNASLLAEIRLPVPDEGSQRRIVASLEQAAVQRDRVLEGLGLQLAAIEALSGSLLRQTFSGSL